MLKTPKEELFHKLFLNGTTIIGPIHKPEKPTETPQGSITFEIIKNIPSTNERHKNFMKEIEIQFTKSLTRAFDKFIKDLTEELNVSEKCAEYYAMKYFNFTIETIPDETKNNMNFNLVATWKPPGQILEDLENIKDVECDKELLYRNHGD